MHMVLKHEDILLDVQVVHDRLALTIDDRTLWLEAREVDLLRQKLVLAARELSARAMPLPGPRSRR